MGLMDSIGHALMDNDKLHFAPEPRCSPEERWLVALSAPLSAYNGNFVNAVETGHTQEMLREGVAGMWGVQDRKSFEETARWITQEGHRQKYLGTWRSLVKLDTAHQAAPLLLRAVASVVFPGLFMLKLRGELDYEAFASQTGKSVADIAELMGSYNDWMGELRQPLGVQPAEITDLVVRDAVRFRQPVALGGGAGLSHGARRVRGLRLGAGRAGAHGVRQLGQAERRLCGGGPDLELLGSPAGSAGPHERDARERSAKPLQERSLSLKFRSP
ncbi:DUF1266 domain-containing protein [Variovorax sp. WS11]|uniref:DUF1266 domain-containing protein n=1 Tax=Variovorax sp. WS11 TaxID=1105204 RepID=UPI001EF284BF|nr:DUF1266 domain-containing protein [Variovorax sp. WS11]